MMAHSQILGTRIVEATRSFWEIQSSRHPPNLPFTVTRKRNKVDSVLATFHRLDGGNHHAEIELTAAPKSLDHCRAFIPNMAKAVHQPEQIYQWTTKRISYVKQSPPIVPSQPGA
jgi:hypothetical protein